MMSEIHILRSPENDIVVAHAHDEKAEELLVSLYDVARFGMVGLWEGQIFFPLDKADLLVEIIRGTDVNVIDGPECPARR